MATGFGEGLPLLHKYVIQPQDNMSLVMTKLSYRLCVKEVVGVIHRRSLGASISEALKSDYIEQPMMTTHQMVEPLVLSSKDSPISAESPQLLSPEDAGYCGTMKSDDSGIVMDDSHMNFSGDQSDIMFSSTEISPLEEDNCILNGIPKSPEQLSDSFPGYREEETISVTILEKGECEAQISTTQQVADFFHRDGTQESSQETEEAVPNSWEDLDSSSTEGYPSDEEETVEEVSVEVQETHTEIEHSDTQEITPKSLPEDRNIEEEDVHAVEATESVPEEMGEAEIVEVVEGVLEVEVGEDVTEKDLQGECQQEKQEERVAFVKGLRCDDVQTALQILNTHYKLSDTSVRKFIITFSSWNVNQISHPISKRCSWWDESNLLPVENPEVEDLMEDIYTRQGEISELVDRIMEEEKLKKDLARQIEARIQNIQDPEDQVIPASAPQQAAPPNMDKVGEDDVIAEEPMPEVFEEDKEVDDKEDINDNEDNGEMGAKKKRRNALQRFIHAMRKRIRRNRPQSTEKDRTKA